MKKLATLLIVIMILFSLNSCGQKDYLINEISANSKQSQLIEDMQKMIVEEKINDNQYMAFYIPNGTEKKSIVGIKAVKENSGQWYLSKTFTRLDDSDVSWSLTCFHSEKGTKLEYPCIVYGEINNLKITKIMVGREHLNRTYSKANIVPINNKKRMYYYLAKDDYEKEIFGGQATQGFIPEIRGYDKNGDLIAELRGYPPDDVTLDNTDGSNNI